MNCFVTWYQKLLKKDTRETGEHQLNIEICLTLASVVLHYYPCKTWIIFVNVHIETQGNASIYPFIHLCLVGNNVSRKKIIEITTCCLEDSAGKRVLFSYWEGFCYLVKQSRSISYIWKLYNQDIKLLFVNWLANESMTSPSWTFS